ncbi:MAG: hypothetical protein AAB478_05280 [Patescibacteria group bacterium]
MSRKKSKKRSSTIKKTQRHPQGLFVSGRIVYVSGAILSSLLLIALVQTLSQRAALRLDSPTKVLGAAGYVLGDDDSSEDKKDEQKKEEEKKVEEQQKEREKKVEEQRKEAEKSAAQSSIIKSSNRGSSRVVTPTRTIKTNTQIEENKQETEIETSDGQKIKTKVEDDGTTKIEVEHGELKIKYKVVNGQVVKKIEDEDGTEVELDEDEQSELENEAEQELEDEGIEISSQSGKPTLRRNGVVASTQFPLSIDVGTNQLIVTTAAGSKAVSILPDEAVQALLATKIVDQIDTTSTTPTPDGSSGAGTQVDLQIIDGSPVYEMNGTKEYKFLAFIPVTQPVKAVVSAESGQVVGVQKSFITNFIDLLSP